MSDYVTLDTDCVKCGKKFFISVLREDLEKRKAGALVQDAFPYIKPEIRELLVSGYCGVCFDSIFT